MICERRNGLASMVAYSTFNCLQDILENVLKIDQVQTEISENGENIQAIIGMLALSKGL